MKQKIIVGLYIRVSTQEQAREGYSIDEQKERLTKYAEAHDWTIKEIYSDPGFSGGSLKRPGIQKLINDVKMNQIEKVIVYKLDRLSRSQKDTLYLIEDVFLTNKVDFVSMTENFDTSTPFGKAMIGILSVFAQLEREQIKERLSMGRVGRAKSGLYSGNERVTTGYDYVDGKLVVNEYYAEIVRRIFKEFNAGRPLKAIARDLNAEGIRTSQGYDFIGGNIRRILTHRTYIGEIEHLGVVYKGQHEAIIDRESFERAQKRLEDRKKNDEIYLNFSHRASFLTGLCWCIHCQSKKEVISASRNKDGFRPRYIGCREKKKKNCPDKRIHIEIVENFVIKQIRNLTLDPEFLKTIRSKSDTLPIKEQIEHLESQIAENEKKIERLTDLYMIGSMDFNTIRERIEKINHAIMLHRERIKRLKDSTPIEKADEEILRLASLIDSQDEELIKIAVSSLIKRVDFDGPLISIQWNL